MGSAHLSAADVRQLLGEDVLGAIVDAADHVAVQIGTYRDQHPDWASADSERGTANWLHDRMFARVKQTLDQAPGVSFVEHGTTREVWVGVNVRVRIKRHSPTGRISTYLTPAALDFLEQPAASTFSDLEVINVCAGYEWDADLREVGDPVISLRDGLDNVKWVDHLAAAAAAVPVSAQLFTVEEDPALPQITTTTDKTELGEADDS